MVFRLFLSWIRRENRHIRQQDGNNMGKDDTQVYVGLDVGSTTVKAVVASADDTVLWKDYRRHNARQPQTVRDFMTEIESLFPAGTLSIFITGSGGRALAPVLRARYIQEVNAVTYAVEKLYPDTGSVVELGGQDAKIIIWREDDQGRKSTITSMNDKCAGGTGATIDKILGKIGIAPEDAAEIVSEGKTIHHIAAKCGVFAETDVVGLLKSGVERDEIVVSLCSAIVKQNLEVLVRGNLLRDKVLLLGGPHRYLPILSDMWRKQIPETWRIHNYDPIEPVPEKGIYVPPEAEYFAAVGAILFGKKNDELFEALHDGEHRAGGIYAGIDALDEYIKDGRLKQLQEGGAVRDGLVTSTEEQKKFAEQYTIPPFTPTIPANGILRGYIGIDGGSTSSKMVLADENGTPLYKDYVLSRGNPILDVRDIFARMIRWRNENGLSIDVKGAAVTGYAAEILRLAFGMDLSVVETVAHMKAAVAHYGDVDVICDVGGQDIKVLFMKHGRVVDFSLNTQCSAGNGYFLQGMADQFGISIEDYAAHAFRARKAPAFNYGCAVFMEQDKVNFQQLGWSKDEIMAGLALVLPLNIWNYVVQESNLARLGTTFLLQGGTQKNLAAVKAQIDFIQSKVPDSRVFVHKYADISGAIGAAMEAADRIPEATSKFIGLDDAAQVAYESRNDGNTRCRFCGNRCPRTFIDIHVRADRTVRYIAGYGCEKGEVDTADEMRAHLKQKEELRRKYPNLVELAAEDVFAEYDFEPLPGAGATLPEWFHDKYFTLEEKKRRKRDSFQRSEAEHLCERSKIVVGIPRLLNMFYYAPFFSTYFRTLGVQKVMYSDFTTSKLWSEGNKWGAIDPCFPAKVAPAHVYNLLQDRGCTHICFPRITHLQTTVHNTLANTACVIQMGTPEVCDAVFTRERDIFADFGATYWKPLVGMEKQRETRGYLLDYFQSRLNITSDENTWAVEQGFRAMETYTERLRSAGRSVLNSLVATNRIGVLMIGHPYHHDPGLNHRILDELQAHGFPILCMESLPVDDAFLRPLFQSDVGVPEAVPPLDIRDVWQRNFNRNTNQKIWAAKVAARHPNLAVIDFSSFKCGHDAPTYSYISNILEASATPHFLFHDLDQNKPSASIKIRLQTIEYFLSLEAKRLTATVTRKETAHA